MRSKLERGLHRQAREFGYELVKKAEVPDESQTEVARPPPLADQESVHQEL